MAGGLGTRLRLIVNDRPKVMANVGSKPFLEYLVEYLKQFGVYEYVFCVGYLHDQVMEYFANGSRLGVKIDYSIEKQLLGTAGALKLAERYINGTFLALNGDSFLEIDLKELIKFHQWKADSGEHNRYLGTIALTQVEDNSRYGSVRLSDKWIIEDFVEKTTEKGRRFNGGNLINAGVYVFEPKILSLITSSQQVSLEKELFPQLLEDGYQLGGFPTQELFVDIGTPTGYIHFLKYIEARNS